MQYNIIHNNNDEQINTVLSKKLKDLEQKEDIISKLKFENEKLKQKNSNFKKRFSEIKDNESINSHISDLQKYQNNDVPFEKYTQIINNYNNLDIKYSKLKKKIKEYNEKLKKYEENVSLNNNEALSKNMKKNIGESRDQLPLKKEKLKDKKNQFEKKFKDLCIQIKEPLSKIQINNEIQNNYNEIYSIMNNNN